MLPFYRALRPQPPDGSGGQFCDSTSGVRCGRRFPETPDGAAASLPRCLRRSITDTFEEVSAVIVYASAALRTYVLYGS